MSEERKREMNKQTSKKPSVHQETERYRCSTSQFMKFYWEYFSEDTVFGCSGFLDVAFVCDHPRSELLYLHRRRGFPSEYNRMEAETIDFACPISRGLCPMAVAGPPAISLLHVISPVSEPSSFSLLIGTITYFSC